jgi:chromosome segregation ATPase
MKSMNKTILVTIAMLAVSAHAKTDVGATVQQLKTNEENAKANLKQYQVNTDISSKNIAEVNEALKQIRGQRTQLTSNAQNLEKNRAILDKMKVKLQEFKNDEAAQLKREDAQIAQLRKTLEVLEANKAKREQNMTTYDAKIAEVEKEKGDWDGQKAVFTTLSQELDKKEKTALAERQRWIEKRDGYKTEADKWSKEAKVAEETRVKFDKLKD